IDSEPPLQEPARKNPAGDARLNPWLYRVLVGHHADNVIAAAIQIRNAFDIKAGFSPPTFRGMSTATGRSRGSIERGVRALVAMGHIRIIAGSGGPGNSNIYVG